MSRNPLSHANVERVEERRHLSASATAAAAPVPVDPPEVVGVVFLDRNADGQIARSERTLRGFTVTVVDSEGTTLDSVRSDRKGRFRFNGLEAGEYTIQISGRDGFTATTDTSVPVTVVADAERPVRVAFGEKRDATEPATPTTEGGTDTDRPTDRPAPPEGAPEAAVEPDIVGMVFLDRNADGQIARSERGLRGFTVNLIDSTGATVQSVRTDRIGRFRFGNVADGTYTVQVLAKEGFTASTPTTKTVTVTADTIARVAFGETRDATDETDEVTPPAPDTDAEDGETPPPPARDDSLPLPPVRDGETAPRPAGPRGVRGPRGQRPVEAPESDVDETTGDDTTTA